MERLIIEEDTVYVVDEECLCQKEESEPPETAVAVEKAYNEKNRK